MTIVIHSKSNKIVRRINVAETFKYSDKGHKLSLEKLLDKARDIGHDVLGEDFRSVYIQKLEIMTRDPLYYYLINGHKFYTPSESLAFRRAKLYGSEVYIIK